MIYLWITLGLMMYLGIGVLLALWSVQNDDGTMEFSLHWVIFVTIAWPPFAISGILLSVYVGIYKILKLEEK